MYINKIISVNKQGQHDNTTSRTYNKQRQQWKSQEMHL